MWLTAEDITMLDNALITMEHIYRTGVVHTSLRRLLNEQSNLKIRYSIEKMSTKIENKIDNDEEEEAEEKEKEEQHRQDIHEITLSIDDIDDHKRQLTFCNVDLPENRIFQTILLNEQLKLFQIIEKIYLTLTKLEMNGHPEFQLKDNHYEIYDLYGKISFFLSFFF